MLTPHLIHQDTRKDEHHSGAMTGRLNGYSFPAKRASLTLSLALLIIVPSAHSETSINIASLSLAQSQAQGKINLPVYEGIDSVIAPFVSSARINKVANTAPPPVINQAKQKPSPIKPGETINPDKVTSLAAKHEADTDKSKPTIKPQLIAVKSKPDPRVNKVTTVARLYPAAKSALKQEHFQSFDLRPTHRDKPSKLLLQAIANHDNSSAYAMIVRGADINSRDRWGWTALLNAAIKGNLEMVNFLLERGADPDIAGKDGRAPIIAASWNGYPAIVASLINAGADVNIANRDGWTALSCAAWNGDIATTRLLLSAAADKTIQTYERQSAVQLAMERGHQNVISLLQ